MASALASTPSVRVPEEWQGRHLPRTPPGNQRERTIMDKWRIAKNSTIVRIAASAGTIVAVAALAGAGLKWA